MNKIIYGCAYYPEYMPYERTDRDFQMMKDAGLNTIRIAESTWSTLEKQDGIFDFSYIDRTLEAASRFGLDVIIGTPTYAIPSWLAIKEPSVMVETKDGVAPYGHRQLFDITNEAFLKHCERVIRKLAEHTAANPSVIGFQIDNETKHFDVNTKAVQKRFVEYLKEKFVTVDKLNDAFYLRYWSNSIDRWEDFPDMTGCINAGLVCEYEKFKRTLAAEFLAWQAGLIREYKRDDQFITHNFDFEWRMVDTDSMHCGYSYGVQPGINHAEASKCLTLSGTDIYHPTQDENTGAEIAFGGDSIRSLKMEPYLILETEAQGFMQWVPYPGQLKLDLCSHLASGARGMMYWHWHSIHNSFETYWKGILSHDLLPNPIYEEVSECGNKLKEIGYDHLCIRKQNRIALVTDNHSLSALEWQPTGRHLTYNDVVRRIYDCLYQLNLECDVVDVHELDTSRYSMIVVPELYSSDDATIEQLRDFTEKGGVLLATFRSFSTDEYLSVRTDLQPHGMTDLFGLHWQLFTKPGRTRVDGEQIFDFMEFLCPDGAEVLFGYEHPYWSRYAAVTRNRFGSGCAYYLGCLPADKTIKAVLKRAAADAGVEAAPYEWPVIVRRGTNSLGRKVVYVLNYSEEPVSVGNTFGGCTDLLTGKRYGSGEEIALSDWGVAVLEK